MFFRQRQQQASSGAALREIHTSAELDDFCRQPFALIFKHSPSCPVSFFAKRQVEHYCAERPETPLRLINVYRSRELSRYAAARTNVRHESPQLIAIRDGAVIATATHEAITAEWLTSGF